MKNSFALGKYFSLRTNLSSIISKDLFVLSDITTDFERIADHCSNIAVGIIQTHENGYESHEYLDTLDKSENTAFHEKFVSYREKYVLP